MRGSTPPGGYTVDDLLTLPGLPRHVELIDGELVVPGPQTVFHSVAVDLLVSGLRAGCPAEFHVSRQMTVILDERNGLEPDVSVIRTEAVTGLDQMCYQAKDVILGVEVVHPGSECRDRTTKPLKYAAGGIPDFWRVEMEEDGRPVVHTYTLDPLANTYAPNGTHRDRIEVNKPYPIDIDLTAIDEL
ncbi:Uma2 family endonuclease [Streptomyces camelliae]|uniref:Uma2 family endonuclease n=1 Tax=Streptomyces camelliae TaxID=3004093 RepID=A0ABY7P5W8_9ACTN|nr:Uma2 family endonuclease [Streptomyces sp. HUAS 2-6]WBO65782.1 Uma2 family endonuclease [Streptomyces sp. HUAS 2-6]